ncbi:MAG: phosphotransferase, partial [Rhodospirillaceae bacterium]|nr:phosphotransferase [Rhodospirillaceae bacterium]
MTENTKQSNDLEDGERFDRLNDALHELTGQRAVRFLFPGGSQRKSAVVVTESNEKFVITRRRQEKRAVLEAEVLRELKGQNAPVPAVIAAKGHWIVQEYLGDVRLSEALDTATREQSDALLRAAMESLLAIHQAGRRAGLEKRVVVIGTKPSWLQTLVGMPERIGEHLQIPVPELPVDAIIARLAITRPAFIKWDARPGNAAVCSDGSIGWFDWEHCGCRAALDDLAWLLGDEWSPNEPSFEAALLDEYLDKFSAETRGDDGASARDYLMIFGTLHMCVRLSLILSHKIDDDWW